MLEALVAQARNTLHSRQPTHFDHEHSVQCPRPSVMQLAIKEKGRFVCRVHSLFCRRWHFVPTQRDYKAGRRRLCAADLAEDAQRYPVAGRVAWVTQRVRRQSHPGGGHPVPKKTKNPVSSGSRSKKSVGNCPGLRTVLPRPFDGAVSRPCRPALAGRLFILMPHVCMTCTVI